jgi:hypothetical protein
MRRMAAILMFMAFSLSGIGNAIGEERSDKVLAIEYLQVSKFEQGINAAIDTYSLQLYGNMPEAERPHLKKFMQNTMGWDAIKDQLADLVVKLYTREELNSAIAFEKSRLGASIAAKNEQFSKQFAELLSQNMQRFAQKNSLPSPAANPDLP